MSASAILELANRLLSGQTVAKAQGEEDPDAIQPGNPDERAAAAAPTKENLEEAREEAGAGQQAAAAAGAGAEGGAAPDGQGGPGAQEVAAAANAPKGEGEGGEGGGGGDDDEVTKAELIDSMKFLADQHGISHEEIAKAFSGTEGDPTKGKAPVGKGVDLLEEIVTGMNSQGKVLEAIASAILDLTKNQVALSGEIAKSLEGVEVAKAEAAKATEAIAALPRTAPAAPAKGVVEIAKAEGGPGAAPLSSNDLFQLALKGEMNPSEVAAANRRLTYGASK